jgi:hypothetical protein
MNPNFQKTQRIAIFAMAAATLVIAFSATLGATPQQAEAARSGPQWVYCYNYNVFDPFLGTVVERTDCYFNKGECHHAQSSNPNPTSDCYRRHV